MKLGARAAELVDRAFGIDLRALATFRFLVGILILADLLGRSANLTAHYGDAGVLPRDLVTTIHHRHGAGMDFRWSIHMANGRPEFQGLLFVVAGACAAAMAVGYRTRLATGGTWVMLYSLHVRNHAVLDGGDIALRCLMFWAMFLPLGARWGVDAWRRPLPEGSPRRVLSVATMVYLLQVAMVYFFSAGLKDHPRWTSEFSAVYYALSLDVFATPFGKWLLNFPLALKALTAGTMGLEWLGPVVAFMPLRTPWLRILVVGAFWSFHGGLILGMYLGIFPLIMMAAWVPFLPGELWDRIRAPAGLRDLCHAIAARFRRPEEPRLEMRPLSFLLVSLLLPYVLMWNLREWSWDRWGWFPPSMNGPARMTGLDQRWDMFAPYPTVDGGWWEMRGVLRDRTVVDLWTMSPVDPRTRPTDFGAHFVDQRWRKFLANLQDRELMKVRRPFGEWLRLRWDQEMATLDEWRKVDEMEIFFHRESTPPPGRPAPRPDRILIHRWASR